MRKRRPVSGFTLVELLIAMLMSVLIGVGIWTLIRSSYDSQYELMNQNNANLGARQAIDYFADHIRGAQAITAAAASDVTFTDVSGNSVRYWRNTTDNTLRSTTGGLPNGGTVVVNGLQSLTITYWSWNGTAWVSSTTPTDCTIVGAVDISARVNISGYYRQVFSSVKIRQKRLNY